MSGGGDEIEETSESIEASRIALEQYDEYQRVSKPYEDRAIAEVTSEASAKQVERRAGQHVNADTAQILDKQVRGMDPSRGSARAAVYSDDRASTVAKAQSRVTGLGEKQQIAGMEAAVSIGTDQAGQAALGFNQLAADATNENISRQVNDFNTKQSMVSAGMTVAGGMARGAQAKPVVASADTMRQVGKASAGGYDRFDGLH